MRLERVQKISKGIALHRINLRCQEEEVERGRMLHPKINQRQPVAVNLSPNGSYRVCNSDKQLVQLINRKTQVLEEEWHPTLTRQWRPANLTTTEFSANSVEENSPKRPLKGIFLTVNKNTRLS